MPQTISIAMATYNGAAHLQAQLDSLRDQTRRPDELIVSDDGSTDSTCCVLRDFAASAPFPVHLKRNAGQSGYAGNFNSVLTDCTGDLVFLCDQDDVWFPEKVETLWRAAQSDPDNDVFMCDAELTDAALTPTGLTKLGQIRAAGLPDSSFVMGCCAAIRRRFLELVIPVPSGFPAHDNWIVGFAVGLGRRRIMEDRTLQYYRRHDATVTHSDVNAPRKLRRLAYMRNRLCDNLGKAYAGVLAERQQQLRMMCDRADSIIGAEIETPPGLEDMATDLRERVNALDRRIELLKYKSGYRFKFVLLDLIEGKYRHFNGIWTAMQDIIVKQAKNK